MSRQEKADELKRRRVMYREAVRLAGDGQANEKVRRWLHRLADALTPPRTAASAKSVHPATSHEPRSRADRRLPR